jgi:putative endonuclease
MERSTSASATIPAIGSQHHAGHGSQFVRTYGVTRLVYMETYASPREAIARENPLKNWRRDWKIRLIEQDNPEWGDLSHLL